MEIVKQFEIGKSYRHSTGSEMKIIGLVQSTMYGKTLIAENAVKPLPIPVTKEDEDIVTASSIGCVQQQFSTVGNGPEHAVNWIEITESQWMKNFS